MNYTSTKDLSAKQINEIFSICDMIKDKRVPLLGNRRPVLLLLFEKPSTRTRVSFESAVAQLGGTAISLDARTSQLSRGETLADTARVISGYVDVIAARMFRQKDIEELAANSRVPVINALTDLEHPCQALGDVYTIKETFGHVTDMKIAFVGDIATNTANSLMVIGAKLGAQIVLIGPKSCKPNDEYVKIAQKVSTVTITDNLKEGLKDCDIIYTDTFVSMGEEAEAERREKLFAPYQVNAAAVKLAKKTVRVMHCLPAHRGDEITSDVLDGKSSIAWKQAENKLLIEKAILLYLLNKP